jgi:hypothetical protein
MGKKTKLLLRRIKVAVLKKEAERNKLIDYIDRINSLVVKLNQDAILDLEIKIQDTKKELKTIKQEGDRRSLENKIIGYESFIEYHKKLMSRYLNV